MVKQKIKLSQRSQPPISPIKRGARYLICALAYVTCGVILVAIAISIKVIALQLAHRFVYPIFVFGDLLRGLEIIELLNLLVFAILGMGLGLATGLLPTRDSRRISTIFLIILVPVILAIPQYIKYDLWIQDISQQDQISNSQAMTIANSFLERRIGHQGVLGFYLYTGQFPMIPTRQSQMQDLDRLEKQVNSKFVRVSGIPPTIVNWLMGICFWGIRLFYFSVAAITATAHFREGLKIVGR
ncbi:MAG: hypothetical protein P5702_19315 [Limnospira sp. PMC 1291.21]|uniref:Uncharacterized protein n=3 Tax=Limnospira TaxID=2596745 RepID=A0A9P1KE79_9CYAN|nr:MULTISPECIES: hypothetical protein [Limnospira]EKD05715.1 hypothetical protein SPLC1_S630160 [Arthrospira platensis C1]MDC0840248.1 hypothetical protein [Limnoraphis robusta]MDY7055459.1 hypothetical protein [Limnospira fusiformis LS22]QJB27186.1 hypothetical protein HFV01_17120 [Limnospira fusiformis SAG 85.79]RAQ44613.1 hypothetical protein B9S53_08910 [Arthrospira sp. O9.13F]